MTVSQSSQRQVARCLRIVADMLDTAHIDQFMDALESGLLVASRELHRTTQRHERDSASSERPSQSNRRTDDNSRRELSLREFGRDITSDTEFPNKKTLLELAYLQGIAASDKDTKASLRQKLISKAELRHMDELIRGDDPSSAENKSSEQTEP